MKPSDRIYQIFSLLRQKKGSNKNEDRIMAVIYYLDEQHKEKNIAEVLEKLTKQKE